MEIGRRTDHMQLKEELKARYDIKILQTKIKQIIGNFDKVGFFTSVV